MNQQQRYAVINALSRTYNSISSQHLKEERSSTIPVEYRKIDSETVLKGESNAGNDWFFNQPYKPFGIMKNKPARTKSLGKSKKF